VAALAGLVRAEGSVARDNVEDFIAVLLIMKPPAHLDDDAAELLGRFALRAGIASGADAATAGAAIDAYLAQSPLSERVVAAMHALAREVVLGGSDVDNALASFAKSAAPTGVLGGGERPAGTIAAGPMARFLVDKKK
jgi:hypothetical protein